MLPLSFIKLFKPFIRQSGNNIPDRINERTDVRDSIKHAFADTIGWRWHKHSTQYGYLQSGNFSITREKIWLNATANTTNNSDAAGELN